MTLTQFAALVAEMRKAQKQSEYRLLATVELEKAVDAALAAMTQPCEHKQCDTAIQIDTERGLIVEIKEQTP